MSEEENLYNLSDETIEQLEKDIAHAEIDSETAEQFLDACFPALPPEMKAKIALFSEKYVDWFLTEDEDEDIE